MNMSNDTLVRQIEKFIDDGGTIKDLKRMLSICGDDEEFKKEILKSNSGKYAEDTSWFDKVFNEAFNKSK
jgi:hypothetical protein